jgi:hypothetical protein
LADKKMTLRSMGFDEYGMELAAEMAVMAVIGAETP